MGSPGRRSLPEQARDKGQTPQIPNKLYFRIGEVARLVKVEAYVLRYWETEFPSLSPKKSATGQRLYRRKDVELLLEIKRLLYEKRFTIEGARQHLNLAAKPAPPAQGELFPGAGEKLAAIRGELAAILDLLK